MSQVFEEHVIDMVKRLLALAEPRFLAARVSASEPLLSRSFTEDERESTELAVYFRRDGDILDVIEFQLLRNGVPMITLEELQPWLGTEIDQTLSRIAH